MNKRAVAISLPLLFVLLFSGVPQRTGSLDSNAQSTTSCPATDHYRMTFISPPNSVNELTMTTGSSSAPLVFLQTRSPLGPATPSGQIDTSYALTDWISHNANYTVWEYNVMPGLKWSDGSNVTAQDILTSYGPKFAFNSTYDFAGLGPEIKQEYALNSSTAVFVLNAPDAQWPQKTKGDYYTTVLAAKTLNAQGGGTTNFGTDLSTGPFYLSNYSAGQFQAVMLRNPYFSPQPKICEVDVNFVDSLSATSTYLEAGTTDWAQVEYSNVAGVLAANHNLKLYQENAQAMTDIDYNDSIYPYNVTTFRQGLAYAINQTQIVSQAFAGYGVTAYNAEGAVSPVATAYYNTNQQTYSFNPSQASTLLTQAGFKKGTDGYIQYPNSAGNPNGTDVALTIWADTDNNADPVAANIVQTDLQNIGFKVSLQTAAAATIVGDYGSNVAGIKSAMIIATVNVLYFGEPYTDILPGWDTYFLPTVASYTWLYPASAEALYNSNVSAYDATANPTLDNQYLNNIQALQAQYLPSLPIAYPDRLFVVNTAHWTNYPSGYLMYYSYNFNTTALADLQPVSSGSSSPINTTDIEIIAAVVVVVVIAGIAFAVMRGRSAARAGKIKTHEP